MICGTTSSYGAGQTDIYLLKIDTAGKFQWQNTIGGIDVENCFSIKQTSDSGFIICGYTNSFGAGGYDAYLVKTDSIGNLQWQKTYGGSSWDFAYWAEQTNDGGYIVAGETFSFANNGRSYLIKTDSNGDTLWTKTYGDTLRNWAKEVHQTADSGFVFAGSIQKNDSDQDFYLVKTNKLGDTLWTKTYGGSSNDSCNSMTICKDGGFLLGGGTEIAGNKEDYFVKTDPSGNVVLSIVDNLSKGTISRIRETIEGNYIMLVNGDGIIEKDIDLYEWDTTIMWWTWGSSFGGVKDEQAYGLQQTADSGFVLVGYTSTFGVGPDNIFIAKTNSGGVYNNTINSYVSVNELSETKENTLIYPNPFSEDLFLKIDRGFFSGEKNFVFEISDVCGKKILSIEKNSSSYSSEPIQIEIPSEKFTPGFYLASLQSGDKKIYRKLLFVK